MNKNLVALDLSERKWNTYSSGYLVAFLTAVRYAALCVWHDVWLKVRLVFRL